LPAVLTIFAAAAEHEETSKTLFYVAGGILAAFAVIISAIGIRGHETFPATKGAATAVMVLAGVLVAFTMFSAVVTG
jgi:hypothetical protein